MFITKNTHSKKMNNNFIKQNTSVHKTILNLACKMHCKLYATYLERDVVLFKALLQKVPENKAHSHNVPQKKDVPRAVVKKICITEGEMRPALFLVVAVVHFLSHSLFCHSLSQIEAFLKSRV